MLALRHGFQNRFETIAVSKLIQTQSDIEFLENLANRYNAYLKSDSEVVAFVAKNERKTVTGKDLPRYEISERAEQIAGYQWITRKRQNYKSIEAYYVSNETYNKVSHGQGSPIFFAKRDVCRCRKCPVCDRIQV